MACEEHKALSNFIKEVHSSLRQLSSEIGPERAWEQHCQNKDTLGTYARNMELLATTYWERSKSNGTVSRITWIVDFCHNYFINKGYLQCRAKENNIATKLDLMMTEESFSEPIKLLDVGSCYNPFKSCDFMDVLAIDISPANGSVLECDFLQVSIGNTLQKDDKNVKELPEHHFEAITFCFLLEYIPSSDLRIKACENAYKLLRPGGLLLINTPDSKHVGANAKIMKCWQYALALIGFTRIKYEKFQHMHCMAYRKAVVKDIAVRWAVLHKRDYMDGSLPIPQDGNYQDLCKRDIDGTLPIPQDGNLGNNQDTADTAATNEVVTFSKDCREFPFCILDNNC